MQTNATAEKIISSKVKKLLKKDSLQGRVGEDVVYLSTSELNRRLSHLRLSVDELKKIVNESPSDIEIEKLAYHIVAVHFERGDSK